MSLVYAVIKKRKGNHIDKRNEALYNKSTKFNPLRANPIKWPNTLNLALKGLTEDCPSYSGKTLAVSLLEKDWFQELQNMLQQQTI